MRYCVFVYDSRNYKTHLKDGTNSGQELKHKLPLEETETIFTLTKTSYELIYLHF